MFVHLASNPWLQLSEEKGRPRNKRTGVEWALCPAKYSCVLRGDWSRGQGVQEGTPTQPASTSPWRGWHPITSQVIQGWKVVEMCCSLWRQVEFPPLTFYRLAPTFFCLLCPWEESNWEGSSVGWVCGWEILLFQSHVSGIRWDEGGLPFGMCES